MTKPQLEILQHSLGVDQYGRGARYRNYFVGSDPACRELVALGYMREYPASELTGGDPLFRVTQDGVKAMLAESPNPPKLTRGQRRYREWLSSGAADCGYPFGDWLKRKHDTDIPYEVMAEWELYGL